MYHRGAGTDIDNNQRVILHLNNGQLVHLKHRAYFGKGVQTMKSLVFFTCLFERHEEMIVLPQSHHSVSQKDCAYTYLVERF